MFSWIMSAALLRPSYRCPERLPTTSASGFGLTEVMISTFIIGLAMLGVSRLHNTQVKIAHHQEQRLAAMALLDFKLTDLRITAYGGIQSPEVKNRERRMPVSADPALKQSHTAREDSADIAGIIEPIGNDRGGVLGAGEIRYDQHRFQLHWTVSAQPAQGIKLIIVTVSWQGGGSKLQSISGKSVISAFSAISAS